MDAKPIGQTIREALDLIREELGPNASFLLLLSHTSSAFAGDYGRYGSQVVASVQNDVPSRLPGEG